MNMVRHENERLSVVHQAADDIKVLKARLEIEAAGGLALFPTISNNSM